MRASMTGRRRELGRALTVGVVVQLMIIALAGCTGSGPAASTGSGSASATSSATSIPTASTGDGRTVTESTVTEPSALTGLRPYLAQVDAVDAGLARAARLVNADSGTGGARVRPATRAAIVAVDLTGLARALPAAMGEALTRDALLVYSGLASRRGAFQGVLELSKGADGTATATAGSAELTRLRECLANGARAQARFARDLTDLLVLAESSRPFAAAASSRAAGEIAVRTRYIDGQNRCCGSCGGYVTDRLAAVVWQTNDDPIAGHTDGKINGVAFAASYRAGTGWAIELHAG